ncbi:MAG: hypothetical protein ACI9J2_001966 [Saprospiraceae bacterium]|jgi:hypothetical protein
MRHKNRFSIQPLRLCLLAALLSITVSPLTIIQTVNGAGIATIGLGTDPSLESTRLEPGFDFVNDDDIADDESDNQEGANLSQVLLGNTTQSVITPLKITSPETSYTIERGNDALTLLLDRPDIQVVDYDYLQAASLGLQRAVISSGKIIVMQAGDSSDASPTNQARKIPVLNGGGVIVGGIDGSGNISGQSNLAGDLQDHYMVAPVGSGASSNNSTAYARARVSAAAARIFEAAPFLTPQQVVEILFTSATDLGDAGIDAVYGNGALDLQAALDPAGITSISTQGGSNDSAGSGSGSIIGLMLAGGLAYALFGQSESLQKTLILDQNGRGYPTDLLSIAPKLGEAAISDLLNFRPLDRAHKMTANRIIGNEGEAQFEINASIVELNTSPIFAFQDDQPEIRFAYSSETRNVAGWGSSQFYNVPINLTLGVNADNTVLQQLNQNQAFSSPYLGFASNSGAYKLTKQGTNSNHHFGFALHDDQSRHGAASHSALYEGALKSDKTELGLQVAYTLEDKSLFGSAANGPLSVSGAETVSLSLSAAYQISPTFSLISQYSLGKTKVQAASNSLLTGFSTLNSESTALGLLGESVISKGDSFGLIYSQPLHLTSGQIDISSPTEQLANGSVLFSDESINLNGLNAPINRFSLHYNRRLGSRLNWSTRLVYQRGSYSDNTDSYGVLSRLDLNL